MSIHMEGARDKRFSLNDFQGIHKLQRSRSATDINPPPLTLKEQRRIGCGAAMRNVAIQTLARIDPVYGGRTLQCPKSNPIDPYNKSWLITPTVPIYGITDIEMKGKNCFTVKENRQIFRYVDRSEYLGQYISFRPKPCVVTLQIICSQTMIGTDQIGNTFIFNPTKTCFEHVWGKMAEFNRVFQLEDVVFVQEAQAISKTLYKVEDFYGPRTKNVEVRMMRYYSTKRLPPRQLRIAPQRNTSKLLRHRVAFNMTEGHEPELIYGTLLQAPESVPLSTTFMIRWRKTDLKYEQVAAVTECTVQSFREWTHIIPVGPLSPLRQSHTIVTQTGEGQLITVPSRLLRQFPLQLPVPKSQRATAYAGLTLCIDFMPAISERNNLPFPLPRHITHLKPEEVNLGFEWRIRPPYTATRIWSVGYPTHSPYLHTAAILQRQRQRFHPFNMLREHFISQGVHMDFARGEAGIPPFGPLPLPRRLVVAPAPRSVGPRFLARRRQNR